MRYEENLTSSDKEFSDNEEETSSLTSASSQISEDNYIFENINKCFDQEAMKIDQDYSSTLSLESDDTSNDESYSPKFIYEC